MKRILQIAFVFLGGSMASAAAYVLILCYPQPFFRYSLSYGNIHLYSPAPIPQGAEALLGQVESRIDASPLYNDHLTQHIFLCGSSAQFAFFTNLGSKSSGLTYAYFNRNIFLRPSDLARNVLFNSSGRKVTDDRTLVYYIAHELTHSLTASYVGPWKYHRLPTWLKEGYADYVGKGTRSFTEIQAEFEDISYHTNREYLRYELMTAYLLDRKGMTLQELLARNYAGNLVTAQMYVESLRQ